MRRLARLWWLLEPSLIRMNKVKVLTLNSIVTWLIVYLTTSKSNIMFSVCVCARFQSCPKESHLIMVKRIIRYLKGTIRMGLWYLKTGQFSMTSFSDADYAGCRVDRKSTSGTCQFLDNCLVSWSSKKQNSVTLSAAEVEMLQRGHVVL